MSALKVDLIEGPIIEMYFSKANVSWDAPKMTYQQELPENTKYDIPIVPYWPSGPPKGLSFIFSLRSHNYYWLFDRQ